MADVQIGVRLPEESVAELDALARTLGINRSEVVRRGLAVYIAQARPVVEDYAAGRLGPWAWIFGSPVLKTGDASDDAMERALRSLASKVKTARESGAGEGLFA